MLGRERVEVGTFHRLGSIFSQRVNDEPNTTRASLGEHVGEKLCTNVCASLGVSTSPICVALLPVPRLTKKRSTRDWRLRMQ